MREARALPVQSAALVLAAHPPSGIRRVFSNAARSQSGFHSHLGRTRLCNPLAACLPRLVSPSIISCVLRRCGPSVPDGRRCPLCYARYSHLGTRCLPTACVSHVVSTLVPPKLACTDLLEPTVCAVVLDWYELRLRAVEGAVERREGQGRAGQGSKGAGRWRELGSGRRHQEAGMFVNPVAPD